MRRGLLTATAVRTRGGYPKPQTIRTAPTPAGNKRPTTRIRAARHAPDPTTREVRADDQPFARRTRDKKPDRITGRARTQPARPSWSCPDPLMSSCDPVIAVSDREVTTVGQAGSRGSVMVTGILVAAAVHMAAPPLSFSREMTLCFVSPRPAIRSSSRWRCEGSTICPAISVMPSWAEIVSSSNAQPQRAPKPGFDDEGAAISNIHSDHARRRP